MAKKKRRMGQPGEIPATTGKETTASEHPTDDEHALPMPPDEEAVPADGEAAPADQAPAKEESEASESPAASDSPEDDLVVVGVGASAGGLEAFTELLQHLPADTGLAFVLVQHLDPRHKSNLPEILGRSTQMPVTEAGEGERLEPNHVYVMPADRDVAMLHGVLHAMPRAGFAAGHLPIDSFFRSLAEDRGPRAIGVVLSGTGSDGALGLRAIKAEAGLTFAQDPNTARFSGMPASAEAQGVDFTLSPRAIAEELVRIGRSARIDWLPKPWAPAVALPEDDLQKVFIMLRRATGVDFTYYKRNTVERRIARRMVLHKIETLRQYVKFLQQSAAEVGALFEDMLINVTSFFRDPESFEALGASVFPRLLQEKGRETPIRIWAPACSTGEEAYSLAIALVEYLGKEGVQWPVQIFATDVSNVAVQAAREGRYPENIAADVSPERLRRFFLRTGTGYQISKTIRDMCVMAKQNVIKDPPFSNLDLISCRNLLIYMGPELQNRIIPTFHYALRPGGYLMLGSAETVGGFADLFSMADKKHKFYVKKPAAARLPADLRTPEFVAGADVPAKQPPPRDGGPVDLEREVDRLVMARFRISGVVIDGNTNIVLVRGQTGRYLEPAEGRATWNLIKMAREGLALDLRTAIHKAKIDQAPVRREGLRVKHNGSTLVLNIEVQPFRPGEQEDGHFLVIFEEAAEPLRPGAQSEAVPDAQSAMHHQLEEALGEVAEMKETLRSIIEQHEATNEELRAANEEIQSSNEELQSTNEELETAKEELQSTNEELTTLNEELENRNLELTQSINDYNNLLASVDIPIIVLDNHRRIRLFTPMAATVLKLIPADRGRPLGELSLGMQVPGLEGKITEVIERLRTYDEEVRLDGGRWYSLRIRPYRTADNRVEGAVLALVDITDRRAAERSTREMRSTINAVVATVHEPFVVLDQELRVVSANSAFYETFGVNPGGAERQLLWELGDGQWNVPALRVFLEETVPKDGRARDYRLEHQFATIGRKTLVVNASRIDQPGDSAQLILMAIEDVTDGQRG